MNVRVGKCSPCELPPVFLMAYCSFARKLRRDAAEDSLGGSGSGKTTLLNAVAHRLTGLPIEGGEVAYYSATHENAQIDNESHTGRGNKLSRGEVKRRIGFVRQQDFLLDCLTGEWSPTVRSRC